MNNPLTYNKTIGKETATIAEVREYLVNNKYLAEAYQTNENLYRELIQPRVIEATTDCIALIDGHEVAVKTFAMRWHRDEVTASDAVSAFYECVIDAIGKHGSLVLRRIPDLQFYDDEQTCTISMRLAYLDFSEDVV